MKINKDFLKARANNISARLGIPQNVVYNRFFYDAFLSRLAKSKYKNHFVLKGGLYLSSVFLYLMQKACVSDCLNQNNKDVL